MHQISVASEHLIFKIVKLVLRHWVLPTSTLRVTSVLQIAHPNDGLRSSVHLICEPTQSVELVDTLRFSTT